MLDIGKTKDLIALHEALRRAACNVMLLPPAEPRRILYADLARVLDAAREVKPLIMMTELAAMARKCRDTLVGPPIIEACKLASHLYNASDEGDRYLYGRLLAKGLK